MQKHIQFPKSEADELTSAGIEQGGSFWIWMDHEGLSQILNLQLVDLCTLF